MSDGKLLSWLKELGMGEINRNDLLSGVTIGEVIHKLNNAIELEIISSSSALCRVSNWNAISQALLGLGVTLSQTEKTSVIQGNQQPVYAVLSALRAKYATTPIDIDLSKVDARTDPRNAKSLLQLLILLISNSFQLTVKQAVALLYNQGKYLAHLYTKGIKDDFTPVLSFFNSLHLFTPQLIRLTQTQQNKKFLLKSIKSGLISKEVQVVKLAFIVLADIVSAASDPFIVLKEQLIDTIMLGIRRHPFLLNYAVETMIKMCGYHLQLLNLFLNQNPQECLMMAYQLYGIVEDQNKFLQMSRIHEFVTMCVEQIKQKTLCSKALAMLLSLVQNSLGYFKNRRNILTMISENIDAMEFKSYKDTYIIVSYLFAFIASLGHQKDHLAPIFLKTAINQFARCDDNQLRDYFELNFIDTLNTFTTIPFLPIAQCLPQREGFTLMDLLLLSREIPFQLHMPIFAIASEQFLNDWTNSSLLRNVIVRIVGIKVVKQLNQSKVKLNESKVLQSKQIINIFPNTPFINALTQFVKILLAVHHGNFRKLNTARSIVTGEIKIDVSNALLQLMNLNIQMMITTLLSKCPQTHSLFQPLVCYSYFNTKQLGESLGLQKAMLLLGKEEELRKKYQTDNSIIGSDYTRDYKQYSKVSEMKEIKSDAILRKKQYRQMSSSNVKVDAIKGLEKYQKIYLHKVAKVSLQEEQKLQDTKRKEFLYKLYADKLFQKGVFVTKDREIQCVYQYGTKEKEWERQKRADLSIFLYKVQEQEDREGKAMEYLLKKYQKVLKIYFSLYGSNKKQGSLFDQHGNSLQAAALWKFLRDHYFDQYITLRETQCLWQLNKKKQELDFASFEQFIVQAAFLMFNRPPKDLSSQPLAIMLELFFDQLRMYSANNRVDQKLFQDDYEQYSEQVSFLNSKLINNPDFILPQGYKKVVDRKIQFKYQLNIPSFNEKYKHAVQILEQIISFAFKIHIIEPFSTVKVNARARSLLYSQDAKKAFSYSIKKTLLTFSAADREIASEVGVLLNQMLHTVEQTKIQNKIKKLQLKKMAQDKLREQEQAKKRQIRQSQLKNVLESYKQKQAEIQKQKEVQRQQELKKIQNQKTKRMKYEEDLKKKVNQFTQRKKQQKAREQQQRKLAFQEQKKQIERLKTESDNKKKMIEQEKARKKAEQFQKLQNEKKQKIRRQQEQKKRMEQKQKQIKKLVSEYQQRKKSPPPTKVKK